jgi:hypothetical protein
MIDIISMPLAASNVEINITFDDASIWFDLREFVRQTDWGYNTK